MADIIVGSGFVIEMIDMCYATLSPITTTDWDGRHFTIWVNGITYYKMPLSFLSRLTPDVITLGYLKSASVRSYEWHARIWTYKLKDSTFICNRRFGISDAERDMAFKILATAI